jgi:hypothetical protein
MAQIALRDVLDEPIRGSADRGVLALRFHLMQMKIGAGFDAYLERVVFSGPVRGQSEKDRKLRQKYQRALKTRDAYTILALVWKESSFVTGEMLTQSGISRAFVQRPLTVYGLACDLAEREADRSKINSRVRTIVLAADAYHLIDFDCIHATEKPLRATKALNDLMLELFGVFG